MQGVRERHARLRPSPRRSYLMSGDQRRAKIRELNDRFWSTMTGGTVGMTADVDALPSDVKAMVIRRVATFSDFTAYNDPRGEHDFGQHAGEY